MLGIDGMMRNLCDLKLMHYGFRVIECREGGGKEGGRRRTDGGREKGREHERREIRALIHPIHRMNNFLTTLLK
jgi:hypothetical protein